MPKPTLPTNWPPTLPYLTTPRYSTSLSPTQLSALRTPPPTPLSVPASTPLGPSPLIRILPITVPSHPASGQSGLFAARDLPAGSFILCYMGEIHETDAKRYGGSDYDLAIDRENDLAVDAARMGNEARFINDYRGVPAASTPSNIKPGSKSKGQGESGKAVANAEFREVWDGRKGRGERGMAVFVLPEGRAKKGRGIKKGEEILVSYGRGFWGARVGCSEGEEVDWEAEYLAHNPITES